MFPSMMLSVGLTCAAVSLRKECELSNVASGFFRLHTSRKIFLTRLIAPQGPWNAMWLRGKHHDYGHQGSEYWGERDSSLRSSVAVSKYAAWHPSTLQRVCHPDQ